MVSTKPNSRKPRTARAPARKTPRKAPVRVSAPAVRGQRAASSPAPAAPRAQAPAPKVPAVWAPGTVVVMGIDPGEHTGIALYEAGQLKALSEVQPEDIQQVLADHARMVALVVFEDSRLESTVWTSTGPLPVRLTMARKVGQVDGFCKIIERTCQKLGIPCHGIPPRAKSGTKTGGKIKPAEFKRMTGWKGQSNEHKRDAAMVAWMWRRAQA